jgi:hypothetical protein
LTGAAGSRRSRNAVRLIVPMRRHPQTRSVMLSSTIRGRQTRPALAADTPPERHPPRDRPRHPVRLRTRLATAPLPRQVGSQMARSHWSDHLATGRPRGRRSDASRYTGRSSTSLVGLALSYPDDPSCQRRGQTSQFHTLAVRITGLDGPVCPKNRAAKSVKMTPDERGGQAPPPSAAARNPAPSNRCSDGSSDDCLKSASLNLDPNRRGDRRRLALA